MYDYPIIKYMGLSILILAILEVFDVTNFETVYLLGFSFSALFLTIVDLIELKADQKDDPFKYRKLKQSVLFVAIGFFIIVPNIYLDIPDEMVDKISNLSVLLSIGLLFVIIGYKQERVINDKLASIIKEKIDEYTKYELKKIAKEMAKEALDEGNLKSEIQRIKAEIEQNEKNK